MPTVTVRRDLLFNALALIYTEEQFDQLCFLFGIELDEVTTEEAIIRKEWHLELEQVSQDEQTIYKIEVPANRENFTMLNRIDDKSTAAVIGNPRSADFELIHGLVDRIMEVTGTSFVSPGDESVATILNHQVDLNICRVDKLASSSREGK